jgi:hypothetical protein
MVPAQRKLGQVIPHLWPELDQGIKSPLSSVRCEIRTQAHAGRSDTQSGTVLCTEVQYKVAAGCCLCRVQVGG